MKKISLLLVFTLLLILGISLVPPSKVEALSAKPLLTHVADTPPPPPCEASGFSLSWIVCPIVEGIADAEVEMENIVGTLLKTQVVSFSSTTAGDAQQQFSNDMYTIWSNFRIYGNIVLVLALLAVVIGEVIGGGVIDAYTARKVLPKILIAAILINLSIYIVAALEDVFNVLGAGIENLVAAPFQAINGGKAWAIHLPGGGGDASFALLAGFAGYAGISLGIGGILLFVFGTVILAAFGVLITLMFRQGLLVLLILVSPIAFALYALPATESFFRRWWDILFKTLLVYPIVSLIFVMCDITGVIVGNLFLASKATPPGVRLVYSLMGILALVAPLFLVPFAFRIAGGAFGQIHNIVNGTRGTVTSGLTNARNSVRQTRLERARNGNLFRGESALARRSSAAVQGGFLASRAGLDPRKMRQRFRAAKSAQISSQSAKAGESIAAQAVIGNDDLMTAALHGNGTEESAKEYLMSVHQTGDELNQNVASIVQAKRDMGKQAFEDFAAANLAGTGTGYASGPAEMLETINRVSGNDRARAARILNSARGQAERARRVDLYGAGFATSANLMGDMAIHPPGTPVERTEQMATVNETMTNEALYTKSAGEIASSRNNALTNMAGAINGRLARAQNLVDTARQVAAQTGNTAPLETAEHVQKQALAATAGLHDVAGQVSTENAQTIGGILEQPAQWRDFSSDIRDDQGRVVAMGQNIRRGTYGDMMGDLRDDPEFNLYRREFLQNSRAAAAAQAAAAANPAAAAQAGLEAAQGNQGQGQPPGP